MFIESLHKPGRFRNELHAMKTSRLRLNLKVNGLDTSPPEQEQQATSKYDSVDELVVAKNKRFENYDNIDFAKFRNDKELATRTRRAAERELAKFYPDTHTPEYNNDLSRVLNARYLQGHGVQVQSHLDRREMSKLRLYLQRESSPNNVADEVRAINQALAEGVDDVPTILNRAEHYLFSERGVSEENYQAHFSNLPLKDLAKIRNFSDAWSTSQGSRFLNGVHGSNFEQDRDEMSRAMLTQHGYTGLDKLDLNTVLSLLRDIDSEGPPTQKTIREAVNQAVAGGEKDYFRLSTLANRAVLKEIGVSAGLLEAMDVSDEKLQEQYPDNTPGESRATRTRVLRDVLRVLPESERVTALSHLQESGADILSAEDQLKKYLGHRIRGLTGPSITFAEMGAMQRANFCSALSKLPEDLRGYAFGGTERQAKNRLKKEIELKFGIQVHRKPGESPDGDQQTAGFVKDWPVQGLVDLYNALTDMAKDGELPEGLTSHTTLCYVEGHGNPQPMLVGPQPIASDPVGPWDRPGAWSHAAGKSEYYGMCTQDSRGHDVVYICDDALLGTNSDSTAGVSVAEATMMHEMSHAIQLGGTAGQSQERRSREEALKLAQWSSLSDWREPHQLLADGHMGSFGYYYDPTVQVGHRLEVATSYGASDPSEDFAEFAPYFFRDPGVAMQLSQEKFLYFNQLVGRRYDEKEINSIARQAGVSAEQIEKARQSMQRKVADSAREAGLGEQAQTA